MKRYRQTFEEILSALSNIKSDWQDEHSESVIRMLRTIPRKNHYRPTDIVSLLNQDYETTMTVIRLFLDMSKDEFRVAMRGQIGSKQYNANPEKFLGLLDELRLFQLMDETVSRPMEWYDTLIERLKTGRGSAIKGQTRGRLLENFVEEIVGSIFPTYDLRCRFLGATGTSTEKADFAIPSKEDARILIEVKAYGATGSKQTDVLGDISRIVEQKRNDTDFLLVTDGITWQARANDLRRLIALQNQGKIGRIYTLKMHSSLKSDLKQLKKEHVL